MLDFQNFYMEVKGIEIANLDRKIDVLVLIIEELIRENQTGLIFGLLSHLSHSKLNSEDSEAKKNFDEFSLQKVENVILGHVFQRIINPELDQKEKDPEAEDNAHEGENILKEEPQSHTPTKFGLKPDSKRLKAFNFLMKAGKKATSAVLKSTHVTDINPTSQNLSLLKQIWWDSSRVEGLKSLMKLVEILNELSIEFSKADLFKSEL